MTPTERIEVLSARIRSGRIRRRTRCSTCSQEGHNRRMCPFRRLAIWTDGVDMIIAKSATDARATALDPIPADMRDEFDFPETSWSRVPDEALTLYLDDKPVKWLPHVWIVMNGPGLLAVDGGNLAMGRRAE